MALPNQFKAHLGELTAAVIARLTVQTESWAGPLLASANRVKVAVPATAALHITTFANQPDFPRNLSLTFVDSAAAASGSIVVVTQPTIGTAATGTVVVGAITTADKFKIRASASAAYTVWTYGDDFSDASDLTTLINGLDYVNATLDTATITLTAVATNVSGNDIHMAQVGTHLTITQMADGADGDTLGVAAKTYEFIANGETPVGDQIAIGANQAGTATAIAAQLTTDKVLLGLNSANVSSTTHVDMVVTPTGAAGNGKALTVDTVRITATPFAGGESAGGIHGTVAITGTDINDAVITETVTVATGTSLTYTTHKAFKSVTDVLCSLTGCEASDTMAMGIGPALGLDHAATAVMLEVFNGVLGVPGTLDATYRTYIPAGTLNGAKNLDIVSMVAS